MSKELHNFTQISVAELEEKGFTVDPKGLLHYNGNTAKVHLKTNKDGEQELGYLVENHGVNQYEVFKSLYDHFDHLALVEDNLFDAMIHIDCDKLPQDVNEGLWDKVFDATKEYIMSGDFEIIKQTLKGIDHIVDTYNAKVFMETSDRELMNDIPF